jgi:hypothetical protein
MIALGRLDFNFTGPPLSGWSENYFFNVSGYSAALAGLASILTGRLGCLSSDCYLSGSLVSDTAVKGDSYPTGFTIPTVGTWAASSSDPTGQIALALRYKVFGGTAKRGSRFVHAVPKSQITTGGFYTGSAGFPAALSAWEVQVIANAQMATRIKGAIVPPFYSTTPYTAFTLYGLEKRNIGRPFGLTRGRRLIA